MKIPETPNVYYGEENGQWQPNGVVIDGGVGGGVVGSGDAGVVYPVHIPRRDIPGYVMAGGYYEAAYAPPPTEDFADYMWMENEEEFDKQVMQQLEEEALMEQCVKAMLEDEQRERQRPVANGHNNHYPTTSNGSSLQSLEEAVSRSTLNPLAAEFVPTFLVRTTQPPEEKIETIPEVSALAEEGPRPPPEPSTDATDSRQTEHKCPPEVPETTPAQETPEVSAAEVLTDKRPKIKAEAKKTPEMKKTPKPEPKPKSKAQPAKSDTKVTPKRKDSGKEVRAVQSESRVEEKSEEVTPVEIVKPQPVAAPAEEPTPVTPVVDAAAVPAFKPINYAAAAKANKPKKLPTNDSQKSTPSPVQSKETTPTPKDIKAAVTKIDKKEVKTTQSKTKTDKPLQRKNSAK